MGDLTNRFMAVASEKKGLGSPVIIISALSIICLRLYEKVRLYFG